MWYAAPAEVERSGASAAVDGLRQLLGDQERLSQVLIRQCPPWYCHGKSVPTPYCLHDCMSKHLRGQQILST